MCRREHPPRGTWVAQSVNGLTLDFASDHGLAVWEIEPRVGLWADGSKLGACLGFWVSLSLALPFPSSHTHTLSLSLSK